jgi:hypothetical protein
LPDHVVSQLVPISIIIVPMDNTRQWKIMNWNIRGINSEKKWNALANKIDECGCDIICL